MFAKKVIYYLSIISTVAETADPSDELKPAMDIVGEILEKFDELYKIIEPVDTIFKGNAYITSSFDPQSHFENDTDNVIDNYEKINGAKLDLSF